MNMKKKFATLCSLMVVLSICIVVFGVNGGVQNDVTTATAKVFYAEKEESTTSSYGSLGSFVGGLIDGDGSDSSGGIGDILGDVTSGSSDGLSGITDGIGDVVGGIEDSMGGIGDSMNSFGDALGGIGSGGLGDFGSGLGGIFGGLLGGGAETTAAQTPATTKKPAASNSGSASANKGNAATTAPSAGLIIPVPAATQTESQAQSQNQVQGQVQNQSESQIQYQPQIQGNADTIVVTEIVTVISEVIDFATTENPFTKPTGTYAAGDEDEGIKWLQWIFVRTGYGLDENGVTGILDEATIEVVKKLQEENELTVDGNVTEEVIKVAEELFYKTIVGDDASAIEVSSEATTGEGVSTEAAASEGENKTPVALLIIVLVIIWVLAIGGIVLLFIFKKKKLASKKGNEVKKDRKAKENVEENTSAEIIEDKNTDDKTGICSMADLFEEAESKKK